MKSDETWSGETCSITYSVPVRVDASGTPICPCCETAMVLSADGDHWLCSWTAGIMDALEERLREVFDSKGIYPDRP